MRCDRPVILISSCLLGLKCNYKAETSSAWQEGFFASVKKLVDAGACILPICPEQMGGMPTPRVPSELQNTAVEIFEGKGRILNRDGEDVTDCFLKGAREAAYLAQIFSAKAAVLKSKSPSCGIKKIYDGNFAGRLIDGRGMTAQALYDASVRLFDEKDLDETEEIENLFFQF
ncbi:MAG: DUF523 domain-containing protein [Candidatus Riflebacteria bacterium]